MTLKKITDGVFKALQVETVDQPVLLPFLLQTLNEVRKEAEGEHDFKLSEKFGYLTVPVGGASWLNLYQSFSGGAPSGTLFAVKSMQHTQIYDTTSSAWGSCIQRAAETVLAARAEAGFNGYDGRRDGEWQTGVLTSRVLIVRTGDTLEVDGATETKYLKLLTNRWLDDWDDAEDETENPDFFVQHCYPFLKWKTVLSMNKFVQTFVLRAEGNLTENSIRTAVEAAWNSVITWDGMMHSSTDSGIME